MDTGDAGRVDEAGRLWLLGRISNTCGELYPDEVERVIEALPWVGRAALVRLGTHPDPRALLAVEPIEWGSAGVRAEQLATLDRIAQQRHWPIDSAVLRKRLPVIVGAAAKIDDRRLRQLASAR